MANMEEPALVVCIPVVTAYFIPANESILLRQELVGIVWRASGEVNNKKMNKDINRYN